MRPHIPARAKMCPPEDMQSLIKKWQVPGHGASDMPTDQPSGVLRQLRRAALLRDGGGLTDGQLLECFVSRRGEAAFEALVRRHGPTRFLYSAGNAGAACSSRSRSA